jgi:geranylgeranyl pyrophosphate synthase
MTDAFVTAVEDRIAAVLRTPATAGPEEGLLAQAASHLIGGGGKRFRPRLVRLLGGLFEPLPEAQLLRVATGVEMLHAASLLHDDVVDAGTERRHRPTVNVQWNNSVAVLAGDWLLSRAVLEVAPLGPAVVLDAVRTVAAMTLSAIREVEARGRTDFGYARWRQMAEGKAGELFAWCGRSVSAVGGAPEAAETLSRLGSSLGVAFQMADDLGDLLDERSGKDRFADLRNQNPSFALAVLLEAEPALRARVAELWRTPSAPALLELGERLAASPAVGLARSLLREELTRSLALLSTLASPTIVGQLVDLASSFAGGQVAHLRGAA